MPRSPSTHFSLGVCAVLLAAMLLPAAQAAELGDISVRSHIGQQLSADIELVMLAPDEVDSLQVRLAGPDIYKGANTRMNPALATLRMSVARRDGRHFLHLTTLQPVQAELLHLFLELGGGKQINVRAATLWLTPEPAPVQPVRVAANAPVAPPVSLPSGNALSEEVLLAARARMAARESALRPASAAAAPAAAPAVPAAATAVASVASRSAAAPAAPRAALETGAAKPATTSNAAALLTEASKPAQAINAAALPAEAAKPGRASNTGPRDKPAAALSAAIPGPAMPAAAAPVAACTARQINEKLKQCVALDAKNAALTNKLVELEDKVKALQAALQPALAPAAMLARAAGPVKPGEIIPPSPAALKAAAAKAKARERRASTNMMTMIAACSVALLLAIGVAVHFLRRMKARKSSGPLQIWQSWRKKKTEVKPEPPAAAEPLPGPG